MSAVIIPGSRSSREAFPLISLLDRMTSALFGRRLSILIFHRVHAEVDSLSLGDPDADRFRALMSFLAHNFSFCTFADALYRLREGRLRAGSLVVTFDDGYADNLDVACPILQELGIPATFFVASGFMAGGQMWNDRVIEAIRGCGGGVREIAHALETSCRISPGVTAPAGKRELILRTLSEIKYLPVDQRLAIVETIESALGISTVGRLMMNEKQVKKLHSLGMTIGGHTVNHPILRDLADVDASHEIKQGKADLERVLDEKISLFAYPNGKPGIDYSARDVKLVVDAGYEAAVSTEWGVSSPGDDLYQLPRFTPWDRSPWRFGLRLIANNIRRRKFGCVEVSSGWAPDTGFRD